MDNPNTEREPTRILMVTLSGADLGKWLAIVAPGFTFLLWGLDKLFEAVELMRNPREVLQVKVE
jgi:hypothetical protein